MPELKPTTLECHHERLDCPRVPLLVTVTMSRVPGTALRVCHSQQTYIAGPVIVTASILQLGTGEPERPSHKQGGSQALSRWVVSPCTRFAMPDILGVSLGPGRLAHAGGEGQAGRLVLVEQVGAAAEEADEGRAPRV